MNEIFTTGFIGMVISGIIGFLISLSIPACTSLIRSLFYKSSMLGIWYEYHFSYDGSTNPYFSDGMVEIKKHSPSRNFAKLTYNKNGKIMVYKGDYFEESGHIIFRFVYKGDSTTTVYMRFDKLLVDADYIIGINHSYDYTRTIFSCSNILSRKRLTEEQVKSILLSKTVLDSSHMILRVSASKVSDGK